METMRVGSVFNEAPGAQICSRTGQPCVYAELALQELGVERTMTIDEMLANCFDFTQAVAREKGIRPSCAVAAASILISPRGLADA